MSWGLGCLFLQACANGEGAASPDDPGAPTLDESGSSGPGSTTTDSSLEGELGLDNAGSSTSAAGAASTGERIDQEIAVRVGGVEVQSGESVALDGPIEVWTLGAPIVVEITNAGDRDLELGEVRLGGDSAHFSIDDADLEPVLGPQESSAIMLTFSPVNGGVKAATLTITSNDATEAEFVVGVTAKTTPNTYRKLSPELAPSARQGSAMTALLDGRVLLFGGLGRDSAGLDDTWVYDVEANVWTELSPSTVPLRRDGATLVGLGDGNAYLFGGRISPSGTPELWRFDAASNDWERAGFAPSEGLFEHAATRISNAEMMVWGGRGAGGYMTDTGLIYDAARDVWTEIPDDGAPTAATGVGLELIGKNTVLKFGGMDAHSNVLATGYAYDAGSSTWAELAAVTAVPARAYAASAVYDQGLVVFGGRDACCVDPQPGTFHYDAATQAWADISPTSEPEARSHAAIAYVGRNKAILFGGARGDAISSYLSETWEYVGP